MPYKDPEKRSASNAASARRWRERFKAEDPEGYAAYTRGVRERHKARMTDEQRQAARDYQRQYRATRTTDATPRSSPMSTREEFASTPADPRHGTLNGYNNLRCRCDRCRAANAASQREYMQRRRNR